MHYTIENRHADMLAALNEVNILNELTKKQENSPLSDNDYKKIKDQLSVLIPRWMLDIKGEIELTYNDYDEYSNVLDFMAQANVFSQTQANAYKSIAYFI